MSRKIFLPLCLLYHFIFSNYQCHKEEIVVPKAILEIKIGLSKEQKKYVVGDTLWVETQVDGDVVFDKLTNSTQTISKAILQYRLYVSERYKTLMYDGINRFAFLLDTIHQSTQNASSWQDHHNNGSAIGFSYGCRDFKDRYKIKVGIILKSKGIFYMAPSRGNQGILTSHRSCNPINSTPTNDNLLELDYIFDVKDANADVWKKTFNSTPIPIDEVAEQIEIDAKTVFWFEVE